MPKEMIIGFRTSLKKVIVYLHQVALIPSKESMKEDKSVTDTVAAIRYKQKELQADQLDRNKRIEIVDDDEMEINW